MCYNVYIFYRLRVRTMFEEWDGTWKGDDGEYYWSWNWIHNEEKFDVTKERLEQAVSDGKVRTQKIYNHNNPSEDPYFTGYLVEDVECEFERKIPKKTEQEILDEQLEAMDRSTPSLDTDNRWGEYW